MKITELSDLLAACILNINEKFHHLLLQNSSITNYKELTDKGKYITDLEHLSNMVIVIQRMVNSCLLPELSISSNA